MIRKAGFVLALALAACGGAPKKGMTASGEAKAPPVVEVRERITAHTCPARKKLAELLGHTTPPPEEAPEQTADSAAPPTSVAGGARVAANQSYRAVAPATVLIRNDRGGIGTGVVIDAKGYVLTNYHVIAEGRKRDFVISVNVNFGDLTPTGRMSRQEKTYEGVVVKADVIRDLAIVKVKDAPAKLAPVKLAKSAPQIAERVMSVGHAGIGFLWAAKTCSIASVGERQHDVSRLAAYDCANADPALSAAEAKRYKESCDESKKQMTEALNATTQGLAVQTDCAITRGDSGGPLVNAAGELVGLNQSIAADMATAGFHVHLDEIRDFVAKYPDEGIAMLPDPFCDGGPVTTLEDIDLDGVPDTIVSKGATSPLGGYDRITLLIDLDQNHFGRAKDKASKDQDVAETFDGEIALLTIRDTTYAYYDTNDDSKFDLVLVDKDNDGKPEQAFRIDDSGRPKEDKEALPKHDLSAKLVKNAALHPRLAKIATAAGATKYISARLASAAKSSQTVPDPILAGGTSGRAMDSDGNGKADIAVLRGAFSRAILIDADEDSLGSLKAGDAVDDLVKAKKIDAEVSLVVQGNGVWAIYDTDNDAKFDLALMTTNGTDVSSLYATNAWRIAPGGELTPAPEQLGRKMLRPDLAMSFPRLGRALTILGSDVASDEGLGSLPDPLATARGLVRAREVKGAPAGTVVESMIGLSSTILIDVDHDTKTAKEDDLARTVRDGKFDAEVAVVHRAGTDGGSDWVYYDTDNDGKFDLVFFVATSGGAPTQAYRVKDKGLEVDAALVAGKTFRHKSIFKNAKLAATWKDIAGKLFRASSIED